MSLDRVQLGQTVCRLRKAAGLTQYDVADKLGLNRSSIANIETGRQSVGLDNLALLADALGTTVSALLTENGELLPVSTALLARVAGRQRELSRTLAEMAGIVQELAQHSERMERLIADALGYDLALIPKDEA